LTLVVWTDGALRDLAQHTRYIATFNPRAAVRVADDLMKTADNLATFPHRGRPGSYRNTRELTAVWPYVIVYRITGQTVEIVRVWHGAQDRES